MSHSKACCSIPPVIAKDYQGKGHYDEIAGRKTYITGPEDATKSILLITDIFGFSPQAVQGADILAYANPKQTYRVYVPDWFHTKPIPLAHYPPATEEHTNEFNAFLGLYRPDKMAPKMAAFARAVEEKFPERKSPSWGLVGFCWGGKVATLLAGADRSQPAPDASAAHADRDDTNEAERLAVPRTNPYFRAVAALHPAAVDPQDAPKINVPIIVLASKDEPVDGVADFEKKLPSSVPSHVETFRDQIHGWMAARADLEDARVKAEYERGYTLVSDFLAEHL